MVDFNIGANVPCTDFPVLTTLQLAPDFHLQLPFAAGNHTHTVHTVASVVVYCLKQAECTCVIMSLSSRHHTVIALKHPMFTVPVGWYRSEICGRCTDNKRLFECAASAEEAESR